MIRPSPSFRHESGIVVLVVRCACCMLQVVNARYGTHRQAGSLHLMERGH